MLRELSGWMDKQNVLRRGQKNDDTSLGILTTNAEGSYGPGDGSKSGFDDTCGICAWSLMATTSKWQCFLG